LFKNQGLIPFICGNAAVSPRMSLIAAFRHSMDAEKNPFWNSTFQNGRVINGNFNADTGETATKTVGVQGVRFPE